MNSSIANFCLSKLKELEIEKIQISVNNTLTTEASFEMNHSSMLRTTEQTRINLFGIDKYKSATITSNKTNTDDLLKLCHELKNAINESTEDVDKDIAPILQNGVLAQKNFTSGELEPNKKLMFAKINDFIFDVKTKYPKIIIRELILSHTLKTETVINSNNVNLQSLTGCYELHVMYLAKHNSMTSSFKYDGITLNQLNTETKLIDLGQINENLSQTEKQVEVKLKSVPENFVGDIIITPSCVSSMLMELLHHLMDQKQIAKTSLFAEKIGKQVISDKLTIASNPIDPNFAEQFFVTRDGFIADNVTIFEKGILKSSLISQYAANKTKQERSKSYGGNIVIKNGDVPVNKIIKSIKKGVLLNRVSGGNTSSRGDFSFVAKNSFYIEDGKTSYPINETMINGNLLELFNNIVHVSSEQINFGHSIMPWIHATNLTISGKN